MGYRMFATAGAAALLWAGGLTSPAAGQEITPPPLQFSHRELANGLDVYALPDQTAGTVTVQLWYDVGGKDDPQGRSGFAHLFEHILSRKTVNIPYGGISTMVEDAGGTRNASTGQDFTNYYETVPPQYLETMLWTHAERMARPVVDEAVFNAERDIVKEELRQRVYAPPYGRLQRFVIGDNAFDESVYRRSVIGSIEELDSARIEDARAFHEAYYRPATATLIVSGAFDPAQLDRWVDQYFGDIRNPDRPVPQMERPSATPRTAPRRVVAYAPNVPLPAVAAIWPGVAAEHPDNAALDVMQAILSRGQSSRLYQALVYERQLAASASLGVGSNEEAGTLTATVIVAQGQDPDAAEAALDAELARMRDTLVTDAELAEAKIEIVSANLRQRETPSGRAFLVGQGIVSEGDPRAADTALAAVQAVTAADVQRVARQYLDDRARVSIRYLDERQRSEGTPEDSWRNPAPMPTFLTLPAAILPPNDLRPEGERDPAPVPGAPRLMPAPAIAERTLPNGLRVIAATSTDLPIASVQLVIGGGASADPADRAGLAEFTANLATQGAGGRSALDIARTLEAAGAQVGGGAGADGTVLSAAMPLVSAEVVADVFGDVVTAPAFAEAELARSRTRTVNALRVDYRQPGPVASAVLSRIAYGDVPYGRPGGGTPESVSAITREDVAAYHARWWRPDNATLVVTGGMTPDQAFAFAEQALGDWQAPTAPRPEVTGRAGAPLPPRVIVVDMPGAGQSAVTAAVAAPPRSDPSWYPLSVATAVLGAGQNGYLFQEVRAKRGLSYGASASLAQRRERALLTASTQTKHESAAEVVDIVLAQFRRVIDEPVTEAAVEARETFLTGGFSRNLETTAGLGGFLATTVQLGLPLSEVEAYPQRIRATTPDSLGAAAAGVLPPEQAWVVVVGDASQFIDALRAAHPQVEVIPADRLDLNSPTLGL